MMSTMDDLSKEDARDGGIHVVVLVKGSERYIWLWDDDNFVVAVRSVLRSTDSTELSLTLDDGMHVMHRMTAMQMKSEFNKLSH